MNPYGTIAAIVEADERTCYLYLYGAEGSEFGIRALWVRNLMAAPHAIDTVSMTRGIPPLMPQRYCRHPEGAAAPIAAELSVVWLPEGNGAALYERNEVIAIIPPWSEAGGGFHGYARDCIGEGPLAWELNDSSALHSRFEQARAFWECVADDETWSILSGRIIEQIETAIHPHSAYFAIDGGKWPPRALLQIPWCSGFCLITVGLSILPMPTVEMVVEEPESVAHIEIGAVLPPSWDSVSVKRFGGFISGLAKMPWNENTWLGEGHTVPCNAWQNPDYGYALLTADHPAVPPLNLNHQLAGTIPVLWLLPITVEEQRFATENGSAALAAKLPAARWTTA